MGVGVLFGGLELIYFSANLTKVVHGGWLTLLIAAGVFTVMVTWQRGREIVTQRRHELEGPLTAFLDKVHAQRTAAGGRHGGVPAPDQGHHPAGAAGELRVQPRGARAGRAGLGIAENVPHVPSTTARASTTSATRRRDPAHHPRFGFQDERDIPAALRQAVGADDELDFDPDRASYFLSRVTLKRGDVSGMAGWRKRLFVAMAHNAANPAYGFHLPDERTVVMGSQLDL